MYLSFCFPVRRGEEAAHVVVFAINQFVVITEGVGELLEVFFVVFILLKQVLDVVPRFGHLHFLQGLVDVPARLKRG